MFEDDNALVAKVQEELKFSASCVGVSNPVVIIELTSTEIVLWVGKLLEHVDDLYKYMV